MNAYGQPPDLSSDPSPLMPDPSASPNDTSTASIDLPGPTISLDQLLGKAPLTPGSRLRIKIAEKKAELQQNKRSEDESALPIILQDIEANQKRFADISTQIEQFNAGLNTPPPVRPNTEMNLGEMAATGIGGLMGIPMNKAIAAGTNVANQRIDNQFANESNAYNVHQGNLRSGLQFLRQQLADTTNFGQSLEMQRIGTVQHNSDVTQGHLFTEIENARNRFKTADNPGEVEQAADELNALAEKSGDPSIGISDTARNQAKESATGRWKQIGLSQYTPIRDAINAYQGVYPPGVAERLDEAIAHLNGTYGLEIPPVPQGATWKRQKEAQDVQLRTQSQAEKRQEFAKRFHFMEEKHRDQLADKAADRVIALQHVQIAQGQLDVARKNANAGEARLRLQERKDAYGEVDRATHQLLDTAKNKQADLRSKAAGKEGEIAAERKQSKPDNDKIANLTRDLAGLHAQQKENDSIIGEYESQRASDVRGIPEYSQAMNAIHRGAPRDKVAAEFKALTGFDLPVEPVKH